MKIFIKLLKNIYRFFTLISLYYTVYIIIFEHGYGWLNNFD